MRIAPGGIGVPDAASRQLRSFTGTAAVQLLATTLANYCCSNWTGRRAAGFGGGNLHLNASRPAGTSMAKPIAACKLHAFAMCACTYLRFIAFTTEGFHCFGCDAGLVARASYPCHTMDQLL